MQAKIGGCHGKLRLNVVFLRPRWGRGFLCHAIRSGGVATLTPPANGLTPAGVPDTVGYQRIRLKRLLLVSLTQYFRPKRFVLIKGIVETLGVGLQTPPRLRVYRPT